MIRTLVQCATLAALAWPASAQDPTGPAQQRGRRLFDQVEAVIGDHVVLRSELRREVESRRGDRELNAERHAQLVEQVVFDLVREQIWVQYGKSIVERSAQEFDKIVERQIDDQMREEVRQSGSFLRYESELSLLGDSWQDMRRRRRHRILEEVGRTTAVTQLFRKRGLLVTPAEMRDEFEANLERFQREASADLSRVGFRIQDGDVEAARANAVAAAEAWREDDLTSESVAEQFGGIRMNPLERIREAEDDARAPFLKEFAREKPVGTVSEPIQRGEFFLLLKVEQKREPKTARFDDPEVQTIIRNELANRRLDGREIDVMKRKAREIYVWPPALSKRIAN